MPASTGSSFSQDESFVSDFWIRVRRPSFLHERVDSSLALSAVEELGNRRARNFRPPNSFALGFVV